MNLNWVDIIILVVAFYYVVQGWESGIWRLATDLISFLASLWLAIKFHTEIGVFLSTKFGIPELWSTVLGYITVAIISECLIAEVLNRLISRLPPRLLQLKISRLLGAVVSALNSAVIMAFVMLVILALPLKGTAKQDIKDSYLGGSLVKVAEKYGGELKSSLDQVTQDAVRFMTIKPSSDERVDLRLQGEKLNLRVDESAELKMLQLVNAEREKTGAQPLDIDSGIVPVARGYSRDMFERSYFAHVDPEGHDAGYRLQKGGVEFMLAGENLAYAPNVQTAHKGLMESEGHRRNILDSRFSRIGIGVINAGLHGMMFTQNFAD